MPTDSKRARIPTITAFTLIELMVVVSIVGVLAGLLFPVFASAREAAKKTACVSNVNQLTLAYLMYENDYDDTLCPVVTLENLAVYPWQGWYGKLESATIPVDLTQGLISPYLKNTQVYDCPDIGVIPNPTSEDRSYGMNDQLCIETLNLDTFNVTVTPANMSQVQIPSETVLFGDCAQNEPGPILDRRAIIQFNPSFAGQSRGFMHARHGGKMAMVSWLDGHVKATPLSYNSRNDSAQYTASWEQQVGIGDLLKNPRQYAGQTGTAPSLQDMYYYLTDKSVDATAGHNTVTNWLLL